MTELDNAAPPRRRAVLRTVLVGLAALVAVGLLLRGMAKREMARASVLGVGAVAPDFTLPVQRGTPVTLSRALAEHRGAIVAFYPKDFTPG